VTAFTIFSFMLMAVVTLPFLFLGALLLATYVDWPIADRLLDGVALSLKSLLIVGSLINFVGGLALIALGIWLPAHAPTLTHWLIGLLVVVPLGLWRSWRGLTAFPRAG
jgi:ethanolamine transporter EutH